MASRQTQDRDIGVLGAPVFKGQPHRGVSQAPQKLRDLGLVGKLQDLGSKVHDYGDLKFEDIEDDRPAWNIKYPRTLGASFKKISDNVQDIIKRGQMALTLGGDHSVGIGTVHGHAMAQPNMCLFWVDAHADINTPLASSSGNPHGMPLSFLVEELQQYMPKVPGFEWIQPCLTTQDIVYIGLRDLDTAEKWIIKEYGIKAFTMDDVDRLGIHQVMVEGLDAINPGRDRPIHLSFDIDSLDPAVAFSTGTSVPNGLTCREGMYVAEYLANTGQLTGFDLVEVNPQLGSKQEQNVTLDTAVEVIEACFGKRRQDNVPDDYKIPMP
jgi:arginase